MNTTRKNRYPLIALFVVAAIAAFLLIGAGPNAHAATASSSQSQTSSVPRCYEDQVIAKHGRCLQRDDHTTRYHRVSEAGWGYWYDTRYPSTLRAKAVVPACHKHQMVTRYGGCVAIRLGDFRGGWWYHRGAR